MEKTITSINYTGYINYGFIYTHRGQLQIEICQVHNYNETDNDWRHETRPTS